MAQPSLALLLLAVAATAAVAGASPLLGADPRHASELAAVFGKESRKPNRHLRDPPTSPEGATAAAIGWIETRAGTPVCTAVCLSSHHALTAGHCIAGRLQSNSQGHLRFRRRTASEPESSALRHVIRPGAKLATTHPITAHTDWALVQLDRPICSPLPAAPLTAGKNQRNDRLQGLFQLGFHSDIANGRRLMRSTGCKLTTHRQQKLLQLTARDFTEPRKLLFHGCDSSAVSSGAPLFANGSQGPRLVALNIGTYVRDRLVISRNGKVSKIQSQAVANTAIRIESILAHRAVRAALGKPESHWVNVD